MVPGLAAGGGADGPRTWDPAAVRLGLGLVLLLAVSALGTALAVRPPPVAAGPVATASGTQGGGLEVGQAAGPHAVSLHLHLLAQGDEALVLTTQDLRETEREPALSPLGGVECGQSSRYLARTEQGVLRQIDGSLYLPAVAALPADVPAAGDPVLHWFLAAQPGQAGVRVVVDALLHRGARPGGGPGPLGPVLARGSTQPMTLAGQHSDGATWTRSGGLDLYETVVSLGWSDGSRHAFPQAGFTLEVRVRVELPGGADPCGGGGGTGPGGAGQPLPRLAAYTDPAHPARLDVRASAAPAVLSLQLGPAEDDRIATARVASPWGAYDLDLANATFAVEREDGGGGPEGAGDRGGASGADGPASVGTQAVPGTLLPPGGGSRSPRGDRAQAPGPGGTQASAAALEPLTLRWRWDGAGAAPGHYVARLSVPDLQHAAAGSASMRFSIPPP